jgi:RNA polymerase sigma factor (sigma-70 family)
VFVKQYFSDLLSIELDAVNFRYRKALKKNLNNFILLAFLKKIISAESDHELLQQYRKAGNIDILGELYQRYMELVYGVCLKYMKDPEDAKDCVINIFEELVTKLKKHEVDNFKPWLYQLAKNHCLMKLRSKKGNPVTIDIDVVHLSEKIHLDSVMEKELQLTSMESCIEQLPPDQKQAIQLFYLEGKCYKEISETILADINKVRSFIQNGRRNLKICMEKQALQKA